MNLIRRFVRLVKSSILFTIKKEIQIFKYIAQVIMYTSVTAFLMISIYTLVSLLLRWLHPMPPISEVSNPFAGFDAITLISICLSIGLVEEGMFRYLLYDCILRKWLRFPIVISAILSAMMFGAAHFNNAIVSQISLWYVVSQVIGAAGLGVFFVYLYEKLGLHMTIVVHACYDFAVIYTEFHSNLVKYLYLFLGLGALISLIWIIRKVWAKIYG